MAKDWFASLKELLVSSQTQWTSLPRHEENDAELERRADYEAGLFAMQEQRFDDAIPLFKQAIDSIKFRKDALYALGQCYERVRMLPLARKAYERLLRLDYNFRDVRERIAALDAGKSEPPAPPGAAERATVVGIEEDRYEMLAPIHDAAHARIYQARDRVLGRVIAMKQVNPRLEDHRTYLRQIKERATPEHPNIARIYDVDERQGQVAMEYVEGSDLRRTLRAKGAFALKSAMFVAVQIINGLHHAHQRQVVHHALMPEHILVTKQGQVKLIGFRALDSFLRLQKTDPPQKLAYVPPELFQQGRLSVAANVYSFGVILHEIVTGKPPFSLQQIQAFLLQHAPLQYGESALPPGLSSILSRCLAVEPERRFPHLREAGEALLAWFQALDNREGHADELASYKDFLLMAWADGEMTPPEAAFLAQKREELHIADTEARRLEIEARQELKELLKEE